MSEKILATSGALALAAALTLSASAATLFHEDFNAADLDEIWKLDHNGGGGTGPPEWVHENGIISQIEPKPGDPTYAIILGEGWPESYGMVAKVRLDDWEDHDRSRAGVGFWLDPVSFEGYTWLIHERLVATNMEFLNDARAWAGGEETYEVALGQWYWIKAFIDADTGDFLGKIWDAEEDEHNPSTTNEPADWLGAIQYADVGGIRPPTSFVGLNGGAGQGAGHSTASVDDVFVFDIDGPDPLAVDANGKASTTWGALKSR